MRSAWASGLHLRSRTDEKRGAGYAVNTFNKTHSSTTDTNARGMLLPAFAGRKPRVLWKRFSFRQASSRSPRSATKHSFSPWFWRRASGRPCRSSAGFSPPLSSTTSQSARSACWRYLLAASFLATAVWMLIPDRPAAAGERPARFGAYGTSVISFFLLEIGDKTQIATVALAAKYHALAAVVAGTTLGMMLADVPVVLLGEAAAKRLPLKWVRGAAAAAFGVLAVLVLLGVRL